MATPEFFHFLRPALEYVDKNPGCHWKAVEEFAANQLGLNESARAELVASGVRTKLQDRTHWALTFLRQAGLVESAGRGMNRCTKLGRDYLQTAPDTISIKDLKQFPGFVAFANRENPGLKARDKSSGINEESRQNMEVSATPQDTMEHAHDLIVEELARELLERLKEVHPSRFEKIIVDLMLALGYGGPRPDAGETLGKTGDGGIDGVIRQDRLGLDNIYLQAKRYRDSTIGTGEVNSFIGALHTRGANKGVFITTSTFSERAKRIAYGAPHLKLSLIEGGELARMMIEHNLGVSIEVRYEVKRIDSEFFSED